MTQYTPTRTIAPPSNFGPVNLEMDNYSGTQSIHSSLGHTQGANYTFTWSLENMRAEPGATWQLWMSFRRWDVGNKYSAHVFEDHVEMRCRVGGHQTALISAPFSFPVGKRSAFTLTLDGYRFVFSADGVQLIDWTDPQQTFAEGPTTLVYAEPGSDGCWDAFTGVAR